MVFRLENHQTDVVVAHAAVSQLFLIGCVLMCL